MTEDLKKLLSALGSVEIMARTAPVEIVLAGPGSTSEMPEEGDTVVPHEAWLAAIADHIQAAMRAAGTVKLIRRRVG